MSATIVAELERIVEALGKDQTPVQPASLAKVAEHVAQSFRVGTDEVAILGLTDRKRTLQFLVPETLRAIGTIPLSNTSSLAARTAREKKPDLINNLRTSRHARVFEAVSLGQKGVPIQKIMSAPVLVGNDLVGVVQVTRRGSRPKDAGPDFTQKDLRELAEIARALGRLIQLVPPS
jgi:transcriptional regulator with GAF, ATPase, and Fis domain